MRVLAFYLVITECGNVDDRLSRNPFPAWDSVKFLGGEILVLLLHGGNIATEHGALHKHALV